MTLILTQHAKTMFLLPAKLLVLRFGKLRFPQCQNENFDNMQKSTIFAVSK